jgi:hypothetical protein
MADVIVGLGEILWDVFPTKRELGGAPANFVYHTSQFGFDGYKMSREGIWMAYQGMWLSSMVLLPVGIFITYKAVVDATLLSPEQYIRFFSLIRTRVNSIIKK